LQSLREIQSGYILMLFIAAAGFAILYKVRDLQTL
jgi:hypothetical protein